MRRQHWYVPVIVVACVLVVSGLLALQKPSPIQASGPDVIAHRFMEALAKEDYETVAKSFNFPVSTDEAKRIRLNLIRSIDTGVLPAFSLGAVDARGSVQEVIYFDSTGNGISYAAAMDRANQQAESTPERGAIIEQYGDAMQRFTEIVLKENGKVDAATERDANKGYRLLCELNDRLCSKKVIEHVSEWVVPVAWSAKSLPGGQLLTLVTIVQEGSDYRIAQLFGGDMNNQLYLDENAKTFGGEPEQ